MLITDSVISLHHGKLFVPVRDLCPSEVSVGMIYADGTWVTDVRSDADGTVTHTFSDGVVTTGVPEGGGCLMFLVDPSATGADGVGRYPEHMGAYPPL